MTSSATHAGASFFALVPNAARGQSAAGNLLKSAHHIWLIAIALIGMVYLVLTLARSSSAALQGYSSLPLGAMARWSDGVQPGPTSNFVFH
jgi:hypothetical protein